MTNITTMMVVGSLMATAYILPGTRLTMPWRPGCGGGLPGTEKNGVIYGDVIKEITPDGELVWQWGTREMEIEKYPICPLCPRAEFAHANTCSPMPNGDIMVSFRVLNLLIVIDKKTREITWEYQDLSLGHQHDCHMLPNGNVLVFANGFHGQDVNMFSTVREINFETKETVWEFKADPVTSFSPQTSRGRNGYGTVIL